MHYHVSQMHSYKAAMVVIGEVSIVLGYSIQHMLFYSTVKDVHFDSNAYTGPKDVEQPAELGISEEKVDGGPGIDTSTKNAGKGN